jgi:hypothetical protein
VRQEREEILPLARALVFLVYKLGIVRQEARDPRPSNNRANLLVLLFERSYGRRNVGRASGSIPVTGDHQERVE